MKLPNWFKIIWWLVLVALLSALLAIRHQAILAGTVSVVDAATFTIWIALLLPPLFSEMSFLGIKLKRELEQFKGQLTTQIGDMRNELKAAFDVRTTVSPQFNFPAPPSDAQLPQIERTIRQAIAEAMQATGQAAPARPNEVRVSEDAAFLFSIRYSLERELRRIATERQLLPDSRRAIGGMPLLRALQNAELIEPQLVHAIREVYAVCSPAVHGEKVTPAQVNFIRDVGPQLIATLNYGDSALYSPTPASEPTSVTRNLTRVLRAVNKVHCHRNLTAIWQAA